MGFYDRFILPKAIEKICSAKPIRYQRKKIVPHAEGRVLEIGFGSGLNLPFYDPNKVDFVWGLEPSKGLRKRASKALSNSPLEVKWLELPSEEIPLEDNSADTIVLTYTLCSISRAKIALQQMKRVLKPGGKLLFCEHGEAPDEVIRRWQNRINPFWKLIGGGCQLNLPIPKIIEEGGFKISKLETMYLPDSNRLAAFNYWGSAE